MITTGVLWCFFGYASAGGYYPNGLFLEAGAIFSQVSVSNLSLNNDGVAGTLDRHLNNFSNNGIGFVGGAGYKFQAIPVSFSIDYATRPSLDVSQTKGILGADEENLRLRLKNESALLNLFVDLRIFPEDYFVPFITAGAGYSETETKVDAIAYDNFPTSTVTVIKKQKSVALQVGGGFHIMLTHNLYADLLYRHVDLGNAQWGPWHNTDSPNTYKPRTIKTKSITSDEGYLAFVYFFGNQIKPTPAPSLLDD